MLPLTPPLGYKGLSVRVNSLLKLRFYVRLAAASLPSETKHGKIKHASAERF